VCIHKDHYITDLGKQLCRRPVDIIQDYPIILHMSYVQSILYNYVYISKDHYITDLGKHLYMRLFDIKRPFYTFFVCHTSNPHESCVENYPMFDLRDSCRDIWLYV
jgi:hypothetical protein